jgi:hypothetical protein
MFARTVDRPRITDGKEIPPLHPRGRQSYPYHRAHPSTASPSHLGESPSHVLSEYRLPLRRAVIILALPSGHRGINRSWAHPSKTEVTRLGTVRERIRRRQAGRPAPRPPPFLIVPPTRPGVRSQVHLITTPAVAGITARDVRRPQSKLLLLVVTSRSTVAVSLVADPRVPCLIGVERAKTAVARRTAGSSGLLVGADGGAVVSVLEGAQAVVEPADDTARRRLGWAVGRRG